MKINRLIEIIVTLLNKNKVTAKELAEKFEVSQRTIYRDIEDLSVAGVPVYMTKGKGGGIFLMEDYSLDKRILSQWDKESLLLALRTLQATEFPGVESAVGKISSLLSDTSDHWVQVDFTHWGSPPNENQKFNYLRQAILNRITINYDYLNTQGEKINRDVEPMKLIYKGRAWYLLGFCRNKKGYRVFRISRIKNLTLLSEGFELRKTENELNIDFQGTGKELVKLKLKFHPRVLHRIYDDFPEQNITFKEGFYLVDVSYPEDEWVYGFILSYGRDVEVLQPSHIRGIIITRMKEALENYKLI